MNKREGFANNLCEMEFTPWGICKEFKFILWGLQEILINFSFCYGDWGKEFGSI